MVEIRHVKAEILTREGFAPYGEVMFRESDHSSLTPTPTPPPPPARLNLTAGTPRLYLMHLPKRGLRIQSIARHIKVTQCLGSVTGTGWYMGVAQGKDMDPSARPDLETFKVFYIPKEAGIKLNEGTWHAGPHFDDPEMTFYNLELDNTNQDDFYSFDFAHELGLAFEVEPVTNHV
ncbi:hypothetical protein M427DRAFT_52306 [Gonapodya prolifera JEL478]|uniref:Ureidoglycolate hydrolase n=1 Tax=Gonapodya prolifera (strain JEL478) TaxID=1344416 RepID=A0A139ATI1_GONPJ|nr:hypothetical protein M427DRAFT_52306 [Gonapodya prolifera JEL478]|eukprot:KXS20036.1 hypothetical protein M427DRAFT_52306 [Gonapodya prolifera JEL478]